LPKRALIVEKLQLSLLLIVEKQKFPGYENIR
jgi:hypothetical protein